MAWMLAQPGVASASATRPGQLAALLAGAALELTPGDLDALT